MAIRVYLLDDETSEVKTILGFNEGHEARVKTLKDVYDPLVEDQDRDNWSEIYDEYQAVLAATPALWVASTYGLTGFGRAPYPFVKQFMAEGEHSGECHGADALHVLALKLPDYVNDEPMHAALKRAMKATGDGKLRGVCWV